MRKFFILIYKLIISLNKLEGLLISVGIVLSIFFLLIYFNYLYHKIFAQENSYSGILKEGFYQPINTLNPFLAENQAEKTLINLIYDSLVRPNGNGGYELELAKDIVSLDKGLKYEITLKEAYWSNGEKITANDVIETFSYLKLYSYSYLKDYFKNINIEKIDNYKIVFSLPVKDNLFLQKLSYVKIIPSKIWSKYDPNNWKDNEEELIKISSGPFVFNKKYNNVYEFIRNKYYQPLPHLEKVIIYIYPNIKEAYQALKTKEINSIGGLLPTFLENNLSRTLKIEKIIVPRVIAIFFNSEVVDNQKINELKATINRNEILEEILNKNYAEISNSLFSPSIRKIYNLPPEKKEEKITSNQQFQFNFKIIVPDIYLLNKIGIYLQKKYGLKIENKSINEINNLIIPSRNYEGLLYGISYNLIPDLRLFFDENSSFNLINKSNKKIINLIQEIEIGNGLKPEILTDLEKIIDDLPIIFLINPYYIYVLPENLINFNVFYLNDPNEKFVKIEDWYLK